MAETNKQRLAQLADEVENARYHGHRTVCWTLSDADFLVDWASTGLSEQEGY